MTFSFESHVLYKYIAKYDYCENCGFLRARNPTWLVEAYSSAIANADTGLVMRNIAISIKLSSILYWAFGERGLGRYLDFAGGYGMLTRLMRDNGFNFYWQDKFCKNLLAIGFDFNIHSDVCSVVTAFEVIEHLENPNVLLDEVFVDLRADILITSTETFSGAPPAPKNWYYYAFPTGQHISFFQEKTLKLLAKKNNLFLYSVNGLYIFSKRKLNSTRLFFAGNKWVSRFSYFWIKRSLKSKTMSDHLLILQKDRLE